MKKVLLLLVLVCCYSEVGLASVGVNWNANGLIPLYDSTGAAYANTGNMLIQLVIDVSGDTVFSQFESTGMLGIGSETEFGGVITSATDDQVGAWATGFWFDATAGNYVFSSDGVTPLAGSSSSIPDTYASSQYYFRWFDANTAGAATEVGLIWDTAWATPPVLGTPVDLFIDYATVTGSATGGGTEVNGGWQTVAPVPEPGTMALFALGVATLAAARRRKVAKA